MRNYAGRMVYPNHSNPDSPGADLITELSYEYYFLTVYDIVRFKSRHILCQEEALPPIPLSAIACTSPKYLPNKSHYFLNDLFHGSVMNLQTLTSTLNTSGAKRSFNTFTKNIRVVAR